MYVYWYFVRLTVSEDMKIDLKAKLIVSLIHLGYPDCFAVCPLSSVCMMSHFELYCNNLLPYLNPDWFLPVRRHASVSTSYGPLSVSLCVCVHHKSVFCQNGWTNWAGFWHGSFLRPILLSNFAPQPHFCHSISIGKSCYQLRLRKVDAQSTMNWVVVDQLSW